MNPSFSQFISRYIPGHVQKVMVDGGFSCPNRDGTVGYGGCAFCSNEAFVPRYCNSGLDIAAQVEAGRAFFRRKLSDAKLLVYFQSYTATHAPVCVVMARLRQALALPDVAGVILGTRPDCMPPVMLDALAGLSRQTFVMVEYGVESANDVTLRRMGRGHDNSASVDAICRTANAGIAVGAHVILGLPGESHADMMTTADCLASLPVDVIKLHQLQVVRGTRLASQWLDDPSSVPTLSASQYANLAADFILRIPQSVAIDRFASLTPPALLLSPRWGLKPDDVGRLVRDALISKTRNLRPLPPV